MYVMHVNTYVYYLHNARDKKGLCNERTQIITYNNECIDISYICKSYKLYVKLCITMHAWRMMYLYIAWN